MIGTPRAYDEKIFSSRGTRERESAKQCEEVIVGALLVFSRRRCNNAS
jgi:hypothetical protein